MARMTLQQFSRKMDSFKRNLPEEVSKLSKAAGNAIVTDLAYVTPVDTSQALSNWRVGLSAPVGTTMGPHYPGQYGSTQAASAQATISAAKRILAGKRPGEFVYISNALDYIQKLNNRDGFVQRAPIVGRNAVYRKLKERRLGL